MPTLATDNPAIYDMAKPAIEYINSVLSRLVPGAETIVLFGLSIVLAYVVKYKSNWSKLQFVIFALVLFASLRYAGFGGGG